MLRNHANDIFLVELIHSIAQNFFYLQWQYIVSFSSKVILFCLCKIFFLTKSFVLYRKIVIVAIRLTSNLNILTLLLFKTYGFHELLLFMQL